jgi:hypothetical protein
MYSAQNIFHFILINFIADIESIMLQESFFFESYKIKTKKYLRRFLIL